VRRATTPPSWSITETQRKITVPTRRLDYRSHRKVV
jgi:hypothetical protein